MDDIPCVFIHGKRWNVYSIKLENDSIELMIDNGDDGRIVTKYYYKPDKIRTREVINDECKDLGMYNLLMDTYYETPYSYDIGDYHFTCVNSEITTNTCKNVYKTNVENLDVIFTGKFPPNPSELLFGDKFSNLINELKSQYDYVIVDTPPVMAGSDAIIVGRNCDGLVMVVRNQVTKRKALLRAKQELERNGVKLLGSVLNGVKESDLDEYYYYHYYGSNK
jgi:hypothetical protein